MNNKPFVLFTSFAVIVLSMVISCDRSSDRDRSTSSSKQKPQTVTVDAKPADVRTVKRTIEAVGSLRARERTVVTSEIAGKIETIHFEEGKHVKAQTNGTEKAPVLVELDDDLLQVEQRTARAQLQAARSDLKQARDNYQRKSKMHESGATTDAKFTRAKIQLERAKATLEQAKARLARAKERLSKATIRAPFSGELGDRKVSPGSYVRPGDPIVEIVQQDPIEVVFDVPEKFKNHLQPGRTVEISIEAYPQQTYKGTVFFVSPSANADTRTIQVKALIENPERQLNPGMFARVDLVASVRENAPVVPDTAIVPRNQKQYVYVVKDGKAHRREVTLGQRYEDAVEIKSGIDGSETVVTAGLQMVHDGVRVTVR